MRTSSWSTWLVNLFEDQVKIHSSSDLRKNILWVRFSFGITFSFGTSLSVGTNISFEIGLTFGIRFFFVLSSISTRLLISNAPGYVWEHWIIIILIISSWVSFDMANLSSSHGPDYLIKGGSSRLRGKCSF